MILNILTACIRSHNLPKLLDSFVISRGDHDIQMRWYVGFDLSFLTDASDVELKLGKLPSLCKDANIELYPLVCQGDLAPVNVALQKISEGYVTVIDDDNLMHPEYISYILPELQDGWQGLLYNQDMGKQTRIVYFYRVKPYAIDTAQFTYSRELIGNQRWPDKFENVPTPDGVFISRIYERFRDQIKIIPKSLCYYNKLA